jgi:hypothetical protein
MTKRMLFMKPVVRVSILRCRPECFGELRQMAVEADLVLRPGIEAMPGLLAFYLRVAVAIERFSDIGRSSVSSQAPRSVNK